jgi:hypothetical protein
MGITDSTKMGAVTSQPTLEGAYEETRYTIAGPANQNGCIMVCAGNLADEKF